MNIGKLSATEIASDIRNKKLKCVDVMQFYLKASRKSHELLNCISCFLEEDALRLAKHYDSEIEKGVEFSEDEYPLLGVPISVKDMIDVKGFDTTFSFRSLVGSPAKDDSLIVKLLKKAGCIPFCKTTVPQFGLSFETASLLYGITKHPKNKLFTPGGSSGGEAALIGSGGSILGIGSDIGGSLRIPSHYCGLYTIKPTAQRIGTFGLYDISYGQEAVKISLGPMATNVNDLKLFIKAYIDNKPWELDNALSPLKYDSDIKIKQKLRIGYYYDDGIFPLTPAVKRALKTTVKALENQGHELFPYMPTNIDEAFQLTSKLYTADKFRNTFEFVTKDENVHSSIKGLVLFVMIPDFLKYILSFIFKLFKQDILAEQIISTCTKSVSDLWQLQNNKQKISQVAHHKWLNTKVNNEMMDAIICPTLPIPAHKNGEFIKLFTFARYTMVYNMLDFPVGVVPTFEIDYEKDKMDKYWFKENISSKYQYSLIHKLVYKCYYPKEMHGSKIGIQVVTKRFEEEKLLLIMEEVDKCVKLYKTK